jgi:hypothetical protein
VLLVHSRIATVNPPTHIIDHHQHCAAATTVCRDSTKSRNAKQKKKEKKKLEPIHGP